MEETAKALREASQDSGFLSGNLSAPIDSKTSMDSTTLDSRSNVSYTDSGINLDERSSSSGEILHWKEIYAQDKDGDTVLHRDLASEDCMVADRLIKYLRCTPHPDLLEIQNEWGQTALHVACEHELVSCARALVIAGAMGDRADDMGFTPLHIAAHKGNTALARAILSQVLLDEVQKLDLSLYTVVPRTARKTRPEIGRLCSEGACALHMAVRSGGVDTLAELLKFCSNPDAKEVLEGRTALHVACDMKRADMVDVLLRAGAAVNEEDYGGHTALERVQQQRALQSCKELDQIVFRLREAGAMEPEASDSEDQTVPS